MRIAIIDDEPLAVKILVAGIKKSGVVADIKTYNKVEEYLEGIKGNKPNVIFMDIEMPKMKGIPLARKTISLLGKVNIIFVTGYSEYTREAFDMFASGYLLKPASAEKIKEQLNNLRYPVETEQIVKINTLGNFSMMINGKPIKFKRAKTQEMMAYLVHKRGAVVSRKEIASILFEESEYTQNKQSYMSKIIKDARDVLKGLGISELLIESENFIAIKKEMCDCDILKYFDGDENILKSYIGEYMEQYSFGEEMKGYLENKIAKD